MSFARYRATCKDATTDSRLEQTPPGPQSTSVVGRCPSISSIAVRPSAVSSSRFASVDPILKGVDLFFGPRAVTGHRASANSGEDVVGVGGDVVIRPEVEGELHRLLVPRSEHGLDVFIEADLLH